MSPLELEAALRTAFGECVNAGCPLTAAQQQILLQALLNPLPQSASEAIGSTSSNPLNDLTRSQRQSFLRFIQAQNQQNRSWKAQLLNDWLQGNDSGEMQFIRERYGLQWLEQVQPVHIAAYADEISMMLSVGDRVEVSNGLWEWVQDDGPCSREWFPCTVVALSGGSSASGADSSQTSCTVRFSNGLEYEIQGVYEWNRYNWRWPKEETWGT
ncbi:MAG TPA: hypothetical protein V6D10_16135 [Trichocoleus sp.]|jgi:hypothetical protein